ncbi:MAG: hypothetical protein PHF37_04655 [Phycisphaerae bacterium]|nr:hypothetical protein [Phycisphaerae bacterium]
MLRINLILAAILVFAGCTEQPLARERVWEKVKIGDMATPPPLDGDQSMLIADLSMYIIELPAENMSKTAAIWDILYSQPIHFADKQAFSNNGFLAGFGVGQLWQKISATLDEAKTKKVETISILLSDSQSEDIDMLRITSPKTIFYFGAEKKMLQAQASAGKLAFTIKAERIPGQKGVTKVTVVPSFVKPKLKAIPELSKIEKNTDIFFYPASFTAQMSPGDYIMLGPQIYAPDQPTLEQFFFSQPAKSGTVRLYLLFCGKVGY